MFSCGQGFSEEEKRRRGAAKIVSGFPWPTRMYSCLFHHWCIQRNTSNSENWPYPGLRAAFLVYHIVMQHLGIKWNEWGTLERLTCKVLSVLNTQVACVLTKNLRWGKSVVLKTNKPKKKTNQFSGQYWLHSKTMSQRVRGSDIKEERQIALCWISVILEARRLVLKEVKSIQWHGQVSVTWRQWKRS